MADDDYLAGLRSNYERNSKYAKQGQYFTALAPDEEMAFRQWVKTNGVPFNPSDAVTDYDMRGFFKALMLKDPRAVSAINPNDKQIHYPDVWKTPYHETFSADSQWAMPNAPKWDGGRLIDRSGKVLFDDAVH